MTLSPTQKKILMYGVPIVAALGLYMWYRNRNSTATTTTGTTTTSTGTDTSTTNAVGLDQLSSFEGTVGGQITTLGQQVAALQNAASSAPPASAPTGTTTATAPNPTPATVLPPSGDFQPAAPAAPTAAPAPNYSYISTPAEGSLLAAAGYNEFVNTPDGGFVQVTSGNSRLSTWGAIPPGSSLYYQPAQNPPPAPAQAPTPAKKAA